MKRFTETSIWDEDWFIDIPQQYKLFWFYLKDKCNHAGIWRPNIRLFEAMIEGKIDLKKAMEYFNNGKIRCEILKSEHWYLIDFFSFQYGEVLNLNNRVHSSIQNIYIQEDISLTSIRGLKEVKDRVKDKDKDKDEDKDKKEVSIKTINIEFDVFWNEYDKKRGDRAKLKEKWDKLTNEERVSAIDYIPLYKKAQPDKQYRKDPSTFLNNKSWNDELISSTKEILAKTQEVATYKPFGQK